MENVKKEKWVVDNIGKDNETVIETETEPKMNKNIVNENLNSINRQEFTITTFKC